MQPLLTNLHIYRAIAEEAYAEALRLDSDAQIPRPDGSTGYVVALDPQRRSFKHSLIAVAFSGVYFEALLYLKGKRLMGNIWDKEFDRKTYEIKLAALGVTDSGLTKSAARLRTVRKDLVHEKATPIAQIDFKSNSYWAQQEAAASIAFIREVTAALDAPR